MNTFTANPITECMIEFVIRQHEDEYGIKIKADPVLARRLAELQLKDLERKGCLLYGNGYDCLGCPALGKECPLNDWRKRNPEFENDELWNEIKKIEYELVNKSNTLN